MTWTHCEVLRDLDLEPFENQWLKADGIWGVRYLAWRLFVVQDFGHWSMGAKPWNTSGGQPVVFGLSRTPKPPKVISLRSSSKLASVPWWYMEACGEPRTKGLCIWTRKHEQQNSIDHFCFRWIWRLCSSQAFAQSFACLGGTRLSVWFCWSSFANRENWSSSVGDCENGTKLSVGSAEAPWTSLFLPCVASPAIPSATFNGVGGGCEPAKYSGFSAVEVLEKTIWQFQWILLLQSGVANQKAKVGAPCVHLSALVEARGTQLWVASFHSDQSLRLPRCCSTFSSISGMRVFVVGWWLVWGHSDQQIWSSETNGSRDGTIWRLPPRFYRPKFQRPSKTHKHLSCPAEGAKYLYPAKFEWPSGTL